MKQKQCDSEQTYRTLADVNRLRIFINLPIPGAEPVKVELFKESKIHDIKQLVEYERGISSDQQALVFQDRELLDSRSLDEEGTVRGYM